MNPYETDALLSQYLDFHFGPPHFDVPNYPAACAAACVEAMVEGPLETALDLGCAVGRTSFELARTFNRVTAVDLSTRFIGAAQELQSEGRLSYTVVDEGELWSPREADLEALGLAETRHRVSFLQGDACRLEGLGSAFDLVFAGNLIDRLAEPAAFLQQVHRHLHVGGYLVLSSPYTLLEEYTPRAHWIGGYYVDGQPRTVRDGLHRWLDDHFTPVGVPQDLPFVIRETRRKYQHTLAELTVWRRTR
ncbi:putative 4-mercaptohistidine N1-methyltransferase [Marinobacteraceae bacterium S3BR75-40.1]